MTGAILAARAAAALICLDPGHGTPPAIGAQREPIGPGSTLLKIKDGGGTPGEAPVALAIARRTRALLLDRGYRISMTRTGATFERGNGGNIARAQFCNGRRAALTVRIHADGASNRSLQGVATLVPGYHVGWTDDVYRPSLRAGALIERALVLATGAAELGVVERHDLTGFNWSNVPTVLVEAGFMTNPREKRLLQSSAYEWKVARGIAAGTIAFVGKP
jgi:N-acetylmuramoyl-L-alanine amidase